MLPRTRRRSAERRFDVAGKVLLRELSALYGHSPGFDSWLTRFCTELGRLAAARPAALAALDGRRAARPDWFVRQRMVGYSAYVDRFGGTLAGVGRRIDHLRELGVDYLHLLPFLRARQGDSDGGFAVASFEEIEPALGSMHDLDALTARLREAGISLCADLVLNHVADEHAWAQAAAAGDPAMRAFFHVFPDRQLPDAYERTLGQVFPQAAPGNFTHVPAMGGWVWTTFYPFQWDLNFAHPPVFAAIARVLLQLANRGVEVFRLDSAPYLWKRLGTGCVNEPEVHRILAALRACVQLVAPGVLLKAEAIVPAEQVSAYFGHGDLRGRECQLAYHSGLMAAAWAALAEGSAELPRQLLAQTPLPPAAAGWITYVRCHDDIVWGVLRPQVEAAGGDFVRRIGKVAAFLEGRTPGSFARGAAFQTPDEDAVHGSNGMTAALVGLPDGPLDAIDPAALRRYVLLHALAFWVGAVPLIYMGDELGQPNNAAAADAARVAQDGRWLQRPRLSAAALDALAARRGVPASTFAALTALVAARRHRHWPAGAAVSVPDHADPGLLIVRRGDRALGIFNFAAHETVLDLTVLGAGQGWSDLFSSGVTDTGKTTCILQPWATLWRVRGRV
ncbi:MAG: amylosucrase [Xanthomonadaceae bacterium]|nr:amylosucrase [Xanthomonadaceae bacterium]